eukprot:COSAG06_NODE_2833_length_6205_cov_3.583361_4_plen_757_part_00
MLALVLSLGPSTAATLSPAPPGFAELLVNTDARGTVLRPSNFTLTRPGAAWYGDFVYNQTYNDFGSYRLTWSPLREQHGLCVCPRTTFACSAAQWPGTEAEPLSHQLSLLPNRRYIIIAVLRTNFLRLTTEVNLGVRLYDSLGGSLVGADRVGGLPPNTRQTLSNVHDGWARWEWEFIAPPGVSHGLPAFYEYVTNLTALPQLELADLVVVETRPVELRPFPGATGATFKGSAGSLPISVGDCSVGAGIVTTAANYTFDPSGSVYVYQNIDFPRQIAEWRLSVELSSLVVIEFVRGPAGRCVIGNSNVIIGVQVDGLLGFVPQAADINFTMLNHFGGDFNRMHDGHLLSEDDFGGLTVTPWLPLGSGRLSRWAAVTNDLEFLNLNTTDTNTRDAVAPGWKVSWLVSAGERLFTSVMPIRPFDWKRSFDFTWALCQSEESCDAIAGVKTEQKEWAIVMWHVAAKVYGSSSPGPYVPFPNATSARKQIDTLHAHGKAALPYMSAFYHNTRNATEYITHVREWKDRFSIDGVYSDGLPEYDWICAYEEARMLRQIFPDGPLVFHDTMHRPIAEYRPFLHTWATSVLMGEGVESEQGIAWNWPQAAVAQFRRSNAFGAMDGTRWRGAGLGLGNQNQDLVQLVFNGRERPGLPGYYSKYTEALLSMKQLWLTYYGNRSTSSFYDQYWLPAVRNATGLALGRSPMPILMLEKALDGAEKSDSALRLSTFGIEAARITYCISVQFCLPAKPLVLLWSHPITSN